MNQPQLGLEFLELSKQKSLMQELLAECREVSQRTIQCIERREVDPRALTDKHIHYKLNIPFIT